MIVSITGCSQESTQQNETITNTTNAMNNSTNQSLLATGPVNVLYIFNDSNFKKQEINLTLYQSYLDFYKEHPVDEDLPDSLFYDEFYQYDYDEHLYNQILEYARNYSIDEEEQIDYLMHFISSIEYQFVEDFYYPYEFIDKGYGVCNEKTLMMIGLLDKMNYSTAILVFPKSNHMTVGIECTTPQYEDYCFMDTTYGYRYLTDDNMTLKNGSMFNNEGYYIVKMSEGKIYDSDEEYELVQSLINMTSELEVLKKEFDQLDGLLNDLDASNFETICADFDTVYFEDRYTYLYDYIDGVSMDCPDVYRLYNSKVEEINDVIARGQELELELEKYPLFISLG